MKNLYKIVDCELRLLHTGARQIKNFKNSKEGVNRDVFSHPKAKKKIPLFNLNSVLSSMKKCKIDYGIISGLAWINKDTLRKNNDYVKKCLYQYPNKFKGLYIPDVSNPVKAAKEIMKLDKKIYIGVEIIPKWQNININEKKLDPIFKAIIKKNFFLKIYTAHITQTLDGDSPYRTLQFLKKYPDIKTLIPHMGGMLCVYGLYRPIKKYLKNAYFITSVSASMKMVKFAAEVDHKKILFGTDYPGNHCFNQILPLKEIKKMNISKKIKKDILGEQAIKLFNF